MTFTVSDRLWRPRETVDPFAEPTGHPGIRAGGLAYRCIDRRTTLSVLTVLIGEENAFLSSDAKFF